MDRLHYQDFPELEGKTVTQVRIFGNNRTHDVVFRREMRTTEGIPFRSDDLWRDWERLVDLGIFAEIEVDAVPSGDGVLVVVSVHERPWWFVAPVFDYDLDEKVLTFGYRVRVRNAGGLNRQFRSKGSVGGRDRFSATWSTPWLGARRQALAVDLNIDLPRPKDDELRSNRLTVSTSRFLGDYLKLRRAITGFTRVEKVERDGTAPEGGVDELLPGLGLGFSRDSRNVRIDPKRGSLLSTGGEYVRSWTSSDVSYVRGAVDARIFRTVRTNLVFAARARTILSNGEIPNYRRIGVGGERSI
jgi:outer membrane protein assembly factor BamA